jgi:type VI protein secretion system component Hcp
MISVLQLGVPPVVRGSVKELTFREGIPIQGFSWGKQRAIAGRTSGQSNPGAAREASFVVRTEDVDAASLYQAAANATNIGTAKLNVLRGSDPGSSGFQLILSNVIVSAVSVSGNGLHFTLDFSSFEQRFLMKL